MRGKGKSQAAMEFLMTYGWALLVVIIVIAALAFFGLLNPSRLLPDKCEIAPGLQCVEFNARTDQAISVFNWSNASATTNAIKLLLTNGLGSNIETITVNISECGNGTGYDVAAIGQGVKGGIANNSVSGVQTNASSFPESKTQLFTVPCGGMIAGTKFKSDVMVTYNTVTEGNTIQHVKKGNIVVQVEQTT